MRASVWLKHHVKTMWHRLTETAEWRSKRQRLQFDAAWYLSEYGAVINPGSNPFHDYMKYGRGAGRFPNFLASQFDADWYLATYADVASSGVDPLYHYLTQGLREGRRPNKAASRLDPDWYVAAYQDVAATGGDPVRHYLEHGRAEGRFPNRLAALLDAAWYLGRYPDVTDTGLDPLEHYLSIGMQEGRYPCAILSEFDADWYGRQHPESERSGASPLQHFISYGLQRGDPINEHLAATTSKRHPGALLIGYLEASLGLGESLRALASAMAKTDFPYATYPFDVNVETRAAAAFDPHRHDRENTYEANIIEVAADQLPYVYRHFATSVRLNTYNIFRTYWELPRAPAQWRQYLRRIDEIWAPNSFVATAFAEIFDGRIEIIPPVVNVAGAEVLPRHAFDLEDKRFYFLFSFDVHSGLERKNPWAVIEAFRSAFADPTDNVGLVLKYAGATSGQKDAQSRLFEATGGDRRIVLMDRYLPRGGMLSLLKACDAYVSLHRSEGFGLGMAESMALGKPVIGTGYSGCADFLTDATGYPIGFELRPVRPGDYAWTNGQVWAEPDVREAAGAMRRVFGRSAEVRARAHAGQDYVSRHYGPAAVAAIVTRRLCAVTGRL